MESMRAQADYLVTVRTRHELWANSSEDPEISRIHLEIAKLFGKTINTYNHLLENYYMPVE